jgi:predicted secreted Zn-dependent protease
LRTSTTRSHYDVAGSTHQQLLEGMLRQGPRVSDLPVFASTAWEVRWRLHPERATGQCRIASVNVELNVRILLPRWQPPTAASAELKADWNDFIAALNTHERGHLEIGNRAGRAVLEALRGTRHLPSHSCDGIAAEANAVAERALQSYREQNLLYDIGTSHGAAQGVRWPPR